MFNKLAELRKEEDGFTLIELLVVILIIGILAAIAIPVFLNQQKAAVKSSIQSDVRNTVSNVALQMTNNSSLTGAGAEALTGANDVHVKTDTNSVVVAGTVAGEYTVTGSNFAKLGGTAAAPTYKYVFTAADGKYTTVNS